MAIDGEIGHWYALFVKSGQEDKVKERLLYRFGGEFKILVPKRKLRERRGGFWYFRTRTLFPGYVLVKRGLSGLKSLPNSGMFPDCSSFSAAKGNL